MKVGYLINFFGVDEAEDAPGLPDHVFCDGSITETLEQVRTFLQKWIEEGARDGSSDRLRHLTFSLHGPLPEKQCIVDRRTPEQKLAEADSPKSRFYELGAAAKSRFEAGDFKGALGHITELQQILPRFKRNYHYNGAAHDIQIVLGRLALQEGNVEEAKQHLIRAGQSCGSPTMSSFGPNMSLARDLLLAGEKQVVLDYFEACRKFWEMGAERLDIWTMYVNASRLPDFGANLVY